jgi:hypothetical protein
MVTLIDRGFEFCTIAFDVLEAIRRLPQLCNDLFLLPGVFARPAQSVPQKLDQFIGGGNHLPLLQNSLTYHQIPCQVMSREVYF